MFWLFRYSLDAVQSVLLQKGQIRKFKNHLHINTNQYWWFKRIQLCIWSETISNFTFLFTNTMVVDSQKANPLMNDLEGILKPRSVNDPSSINGYLNPHLATSDVHNGYIFIARYRLNAIFF